MHRVEWQSIFFSGNYSIKLLAFHLYVILGCLSIVIQSLLKLFTYNIYIYIYIFSSKAYIKIVQRPNRMRYRYVGKLTPQQTATQFTVLDSCQSSDLLMSLCCLNRCPASFAA
jgi:hypothetical protein